MRKGLLIVFTGSGKGKTTAALGMVLRAAGHGMRTLVVQFLKGTWKYGELEAIKKIPEIDILPVGSGFTWKKNTVDEDLRLAREGWDMAAEAIKRSEYDIIVLDELSYVLSYGLLPQNEVLAVLFERPKHLHVVVTGRSASEELISMADLVTEMREVKHPFHDQGIKAQEGIEY